MELYLRWRDHKSHHVSLSLSSALYVFNHTEMIYFSVSRVTTLPFIFQIVCVFLDDKFIFRQPQYD